MYFKCNFYELFINVYIIVKIVFTWIGCPWDGWRIPGWCWSSGGCMMWEFGWDWNHEQNSFTKEFANVQFASLLKPISLFFILFLQKLNYLLRLYICSLVICIVGITLKHQLLLISLNYSEKKDIDIWIS